MKTEYPKKTSHGIMFHHFHNENHYKGQGSISAQDFEDILQFVGLDRIINPDEWIKRLNAGKLREEDICLTLDDGLLCQFDIALPILDKYGMRAFWFIYSSVFEGQPGKFELYRVFRSKYFNDIEDFYRIFFERIYASEFSDKARKAMREINLTKYKKIAPFYTTNDIYYRVLRDRVLNSKSFEGIMDQMIKDFRIDLDDLAENIWMSNQTLGYLSDHGHAVGLHSYSHPMVLSTLSVEEQWNEYSKNYRHLAQICGKPVAMAHPVNSYNDDTLEILKKLNIVCGFRANMFPRHEGDPPNLNNLEIAREDHANIMRHITHKVGG